MQIWKTLLLILSSYLLGSIPVAFVAARGIKGIDIRRYGSGTVSGSMIFEHVNRWLVVPVGILDIAKAALPTYLGLLWGFGEAGAAAAGLAALVGHNWPVYLKFVGGRGISPFLGILLVLFPWGAVWLLAWLAIGYALKDSAPFALVSIASMPLLVWLLEDSSVLFWLIGVTLVVMLAKRLEANRRPLPPPGLERRRMLWMRLIYDRDMMDHQTWIHRQV
jgi:glycerol-3-phosphate acyltransferase PlsY